MSETAGCGHEPPTPSHHSERRYPSESWIEEISFEECLLEKIAELREPLMEQCLTEQIEKDINAVYGPGHVVHQALYKGPTCLAGAILVMIYRAPLFDEDGKWNEKNLLYCEWGRTSIEALQAAHTFSDRALHAQDDGALPKYLQKKVQEYSDKLKSKARRSVKELV